MNVRTQMAGKPVPSFTAHGGLLQRKCACTGLTGSCEECDKKRLQKKSAHGETRAFMESPFGHDFSRVRVHARASEALPLPRSGANSAQHLTIKGQLIGDESSSSEETSGTSAESPEEAVGEPLDSPVETGNSKCPVTAVFSSTLAGKEKANCQVPEKQFGAATLARFVLHGVKADAGSQTINEQFKKLKDEYGVFRLLKPNTYTTSGNIFDDCYSLFSPDPLPSDLELQVEQNHLLNGQIISKNIITFTPSRISIRSCKRVRGKCDFAAVCRR